MVWLAGRACVTFSAEIGWLLAAIVDVSFLVLVVAATAREIVAGKNWRNLRVVGLVTLLLAGNIAFHIEAHVRGTAEYGARAGIAAVVLLIVVIGGRIVPSFTRNWLTRENPGRLPVPFARFDVVTMAVTAAALVLWIVQPTGQLVAAALVITGLLNTVRLARWAGDRTYHDRLVLILHVGYAFVPLGFLLASVAALDIIVSGAGVHAWTVGAAGTMTLAVMTRASLGHTGHALVASPMTQAIYATVVIASLARICASLEPGWSDALLHITAFAWCIAFFGFACRLGQCSQGAVREHRRRSSRAYYIYHKSERLVWFAPYKLSLSHGSPSLALSSLRPSSLKPGEAPCLLLTHSGHRHAYAQFSQLRALPERTRLLR